MLNALAARPLAQSCPGGGGGEPLLPCRCGKGLAERLDPLTWSRLAISQCRLFPEPKASICNIWTQSLRDGGVAPALHSPGAAPASQPIPRDDAFCWKFSKHKETYPLGYEQRPVDLLSNVA